jgi:hypothetical protein
MSAFMAQTGVIVVLGDAGEALGDSMYERTSTSAAPRRPRRRRASRRSCATSTAARSRGCSPTPAVDGVDVSDFRRYGSARQLYNFKIDNTYCGAAR